MTTAIARRVLVHPPLFSQTPPPTCQLVRKATFSPCNLHVRGSLRPEVTFPCTCGPFLTTCMCTFTSKHQLFCQTDIQVEIWWWELALHPHTKQSFSGNESLPATQTVAHAIMSQHTDLYDPILAICFLFFVCISSNNTYIDGPAGLCYWQLIKKGTLQGSFRPSS